MLFNSLPFLLIFLPLSLGGYYLLGALQPLAAAAWLCVASLIFYGWWDPSFVVLLLASIAFNYILSLGILATESRQRLQLWILVCGIVANLSLLFYYKYLVALLGFLGSYGLVSHSVSEMILPLGISFFTFTQLGYLLDCRAGVVKERGFVSYVLFVTFFPHLIAGPILHHKEMMPQFANRENYRLKAENLSIGATLFVIGLAKKVLLADSIAPWAEAGFNQPADQQLLGAWGTALAYALQLYFDFSGYSDMAMGLAKMFGISFPLNFNSPYKSTGIIEFWQRFHMTLTRYLTAYLYNPIALTITRARAQKGLPVGRKATKTLRGFSGMVLFPTVLTMGLAGVWHGAGLQFLIFGLLHGAYLTVNHAWRQFGPARSKAPGFFLNSAFVLLTFLCVVVALLFFRAHSTADAFSIIGGMIGLHGVESLQPVLFPFHSLFGGADDWTTTQVIRLLIERWSQGLLILALLLVVWCAPNSNQIMSVYTPSLEGVDDVAPRWLRWRPTVAWALVSGMILFYCMLNLHKTARFLYFQF